MGQPLIAFDVYTPTKALVEAEALIWATEGESISPLARIWKTTDNPIQKEFVFHAQKVRKDLNKIPELQAWARMTAEDINEILEQHGFSIRLRSWPKGLSFGVVAISDLPVKWKVEGATSFRGEKILINDRPGFRLTEKDADVTFYQKRGQVVIRLPGQQAGDYVCMMKFSPEVPLTSDLELISAVVNIRDNCYQYSKSLEDHTWQAVRLPNVTFDIQPDISWLLGLSIGDFFVAQALMQAKFAMGPKGARSKVAVAVSMKRGAMHRPQKDQRPDYVLDSDFLLWIEREDVSLPLFAAYIPKENFSKKEVDIDNL